MSADAQFDIFRAWATCGYLLCVYKLVIKNLANAFLPHSCIHGRAYTVVFGYIILGILIPDETLLLVFTILLLSVWI